MLHILLLLSALTLSLRIAYILREISTRRNRKRPKISAPSSQKPHRDDSVSTKKTIQRTKPTKTTVVLGSGGHTTEMLRLLSSLDRRRYTPLTYIIADTDTTSLNRLNHDPDGRKPLKTYKIPRSREVGQSYITSAFTTFYAILYSVCVVARVRPDLVLCNGPGTCFPIVIMTFVLRVLGFCEGKVVFVESFCRVESLSLTGRLVYPVVDKFIIHWEGLQTKYPSSEVIETLVRRNPPSH